LQSFSSAYQKQSTEGEKSMSGKRNKRIRRVIKKQFGNDFVALHNMICDEPFPTRWRIGWELIRKKRKAT
jgi:hypothetical protein